ncbi:hypothetical protein Hanom_Chr14g01271051 [Helianthus anomalus]
MVMYASVRRWMVVPWSGISIVRDKGEEDWLDCDVMCKGLQTSSTFCVLFKDKGHSLQSDVNIKDDFCNLLLYLS